MRTFVVLQYINVLYSVCMYMFHSCPVAPSAARHFTLFVCLPSSTPFVALSPLLVSRSTLLWNNLLLRLRSPAVLYYFFPSFRISPMKCLGHPMSRSACWLLLPGSKKKKEKKEKKKKKKKGQKAGTTQLCELEFLLMVRFEVPRWRFVIVLATSVQLT